MKMTSSVAWMTEYDGVGNGYGYSVHNKMMRKHTEKYIKIDPDSDTAITILPADRYFGTDKKKNFLFTMFEADRIPNSYMNGLLRADEIITPCRFVKDLFSKYVDKPIHVCWEGVDSDVYKYQERQWRPGEKFRILWVGAPNPRKGYPIMLELIRAFENTPEIEIYIKTTVEKDSWEAIAQKRGFKTPAQIERDKLVQEAIGEVKPLEGMYQVLGKNKNVIFDARNMTNDELLNLYYSCQCFVLPTFGEGWGLSLSEAMATGAPCVAPQHTGCADFFDDRVGYPISYKMSEFVDMKNYLLKARMFQPSANDTFRQIVSIAQNYKEAKKRAERAARRMKEKFNWDNAGRRLAEIIQGAKA